MTNMTNDENGLQILSGSLVLCFDTLAEALESLSKMPYGIKFKVTSDGDKNGRYTWDGSQLSKTTNNVLDKIKEEAEKIVEEATKDSVNKDNILDILNGEVNLSILEAELAERIEAIPDISNKVNELSKRTEGLSEDLDKKVNRVNNLVDDLDYTLNDIRNNLGLTDFTDINNKIDELQKQVTDDYNAVLAKVEELQKEADLALKDVLVEVDGIKADVAQEVSDRIEAIRAENASRIEAIENLQDGITQEKNERIDGDTKILTNLENYKTSNDQAMSNFQEKLDVVVDESRASVEKVESMDARVKSAEDASGNALTNSASALEKVDIAVNDVVAMSGRVESLESNLQKAVDDSGNALTNSANALREAETAVTKTTALAEDFTTLKTTVEGEIKTNTDAISGLKTQVSDVDGKIDAESKRIDALSGSIEGKADGSALDELKVTVSDQGDALKSQSQSILALDNSIKGKADSSSVDSLKSTVDAQGEDIKAQGQAITGLTNSLTGKADASAIDLLKTEVSEIDGKLETQAKSITSLEGSVANKADTSALSALETTVIQQGKDISSQATEVTGLKASLAGAYSGSSNLIKNSNLLEGFSLVGTGTLKALDTSVAKTSALFVEAKATKASDVFGLRTVGTFALKSGVTYTLTYRCTSSPQKISVALVNSAGTVEEVISDSVDSTDTLTNARTKKVTFSYDGTPSGNLYLKFFVKDAVVDSVVNLTEPMLIEGTLGASWAKSPEDFATGSAVESLTTRVGKTEETITSQGQALTGLRNDVDGKASSQAVSELTTKVEIQGATLNDQGQLITEQGIIIDSQGNVLDEQGKIVATTAKDLADLGITVKSQGQSIDSLQTTIEGKADSSALNTLETTVIDQGKKLESQSTAITSVQTTIGDLKVGGTNLLASTAKGGFEKLGGGSFTETTNLSFKTTVLKLIRDNTATTSFAGFVSKAENSKINLRAGTTYTVSFKARGSLRPNSVVLTKASSTGEDLAVASGNFKNLTGVNSSTFVVVSGKLTPSVDVKGVGGLKIGNSSGSANYWLEIAEVIVQEGDVVTDWMPSSQDLDAIKSLADASASGFSTLTAKVDKNAEDIVAQSKKIDNVEASIKDKADASAVSALGTKVEEQGKAISTQSDQYTELKGAVDGKAETSAVDALTTRVTSAEGKISTQTSDISKLNTTVAGKADTSAVNALTTRVTTAEGKINTNTTNITNLTTTVGKKADASAVDALEISVDKLGEDYEAVSSSMTALKSSYQSTITELSIDGRTSASNIVRSTDVAEMVKVESTSAIGGYIWKIGNNNGNDDVWIHPKDLMTIDPNKLYKLTAKFKRVTGTGKIYFGVACKQSEDGFYVTSGNGYIKDMASSIYLYSNQAPALGTVVELEYYMKGKSTGASTGSGTLANPRTFPASANMFAPLFIANYASASGEVELEFIKVAFDEVTEGFTSNGKAISDLQTKTTNIEGNVSTLTTKVSSLETTTTNLNTGLASKASVAQLETAKTDLNSAITSTDTKLTARLDGISLGSTNLIDKSNLKAGYLATNTGIPAGTTGSGNADVYDEVYYPAKAGEAFICTRVDANTTPTGSSARIAWYDAEKTFISTANILLSSSAVGASLKPVAPANTAFYRYGIVNPRDRVKLERGKTFSGWTAEDEKAWSGVTAMATAISSTQADVTRIDGVLVSQASQVTALESRNFGDQVSNMLPDPTFSQPSVYWGGSKFASFKQVGAKSDSYVSTMFPYPALASVMTATGGTGGAYYGDFCHEYVPIISGRTYSLSGSIRSYLSGLKGLVQVQLIPTSAENTTALRWITAYTLDLATNKKTVNKYSYRFTANEGENQLLVRFRFQYDANGEVNYTYLAFPDIRLEVEADTVSTAINELTTTVTQQGKDIIAQSTATTNLEAKLDNQKIGGTNLLTNSSWVYGKGLWNFSATNFEIISPQMDKPNSPILRCKPVASTTQQTTQPSLVMPVVANEDFTISFDYKHNGGVSATSVIGNIRIFEEVTTATGASDSIEDSYIRISDLPSGVDTTLVFGRVVFKYSPKKTGYMKFQVYDNSNSGKHEAWYREIQIERGSVATDWKPSYLDTPDIDLSGYATAKALSDVTVRVENTEKGLSTQATSIDKLVTSDGKNTSAIETQAKSIDGLSAQWTLKTDVNGYVSGMGTYNNGTTSEIVFRTDKFSIANPTGTGKTSGFVYQSSAVTLPNGTVIPAGLKVNSAVIGELDVKKLNATSLSSVSATIGTLRTKTSGERVEIKDNQIHVFDASNVLRVEIGLLT